MFNWRHCRLLPETARPNLADYSGEVGRKFVFEAALRGTKRRSYGLNKPKVRMKTFERNFRGKLQRKTSEGNFRSNIQLLRNPGKIPV